MQVMPSVEFMLLFLGLGGAPFAISYLRTGDKKQLLAALSLLWMAITFFRLRLINTDGNAELPIKLTDPFALPLLLLPAITAYFAGRNVNIPKYQRLTEIFPIPLGLLYVFFSDASIPVAAFAIICAAILIAYAYIIVAHWRFLQEKTGYTLSLSVLGIILPIFALYTMHTLAVLTEELPRWIWFFLTLFSGLCILSSMASSLISYFPHSPVAEAEASAVTDADAVEIDPEEESVPVPGQKLVSVHKESLFDRFVLHYTLTPKEAEVACLMLAGMSNKQIGDSLIIAEGTVKCHTYHIYRKIGVTNRKLFFVAWESFGRESRLA